MIVNQHVAWLRKRKFIPPLKINAVIIESVASGGELISANSATAELIGLSGLVGLLMPTGQAFKGFLKLPIDIDLQYPIGVKIYYTVSLTTPGSATAITWTVTAGVGLVGVNLASGITLGALQTTIGVQVPFNTSDWLLDITSRGVLSLVTTSALKQTDLENGVVLEYNIVPSAFTNVVLVLFLGVEFDYVPQLLSGDRNLHDRPLTSVSVLHQ